MSNGLHRIAAQAASRLNLALGRDSVWRGRCPCCGYGKPTVQIKVQDHGIGVSCLACGQGDKIAAIAGIAPNLLESVRKHQTGLQSFRSPCHR